METAIGDAAGQAATVAAQYHYSVVIQFDPRDGIYIADVPELPGCRAHGDSYEEASHEIQEAIGAWLDAAKRLGDRVPTPRYWEPRGV